NHVDLVIMGAATHGLQLQRLIATVPIKVAMHAPCMVMLVKAGGLFAPTSCARERACRGDGIMPAHPGSRHGMGRSAFLGKSCIERCLLPCWQSEPVVRLPPRRRTTPGG